MSVNFTINRPLLLDAKVIEDEEEGTFEGFYCLQIGAKFRSLHIGSGLYTRETLLSPPPALFLELEYDRNRTEAAILRSSEIPIYFNSPLEGVSNSWHDTRVEYQNLEIVKQLTSTTFETIPHSDLLPPGAVFAKICFFYEWLDVMEQETRAYELLKDTGVTPRFLGHIHQHGSVIGFLLERVEGRPPSVQDQDACEAALQKVHELGVAHGYIKLSDFLVTGEGVKIIEFARFRENASRKSLRKESRRLRAMFSKLASQGTGKRTTPGTTTLIERPKKRRKYN
ncbi:alpha-galactosidase A [Nemania abortiva]|nr:alpha-galactosidase A [Nemania abortiva]